MPREEQPLAKLSLGTINNMRSEMYRLLRMMRVEPEAEAFASWQARASYLRQRLGEEAIPLRERGFVASPAQHPSIEDPSAQAADEALKEILELAAEPPVKQRKQTVSALTCPRCSLMMIFEIEVRRATCSNCELNLAGVQPKKVELLVEVDE